MREELALPRVKPPSDALGVLADSRRAPRGGDARPIMVGDHTQRIGGVDRRRKACNDCRRPLSLSCIALAATCTARSADEVSKRINGTPPA